MLSVALVLAGLAALVHLYIFTLESLLFDRPSTWRRFGVPDAEQAAVLQPVFYQQGFYNLFLAIGTAGGIGLAAGGSRDAGLALVVLGCASMFAAALVLLSSRRSLARAAAVQGALPMLALLALAVRSLL